MKPVKARWIRRMVRVALIVLVTTIITALYSALSIFFYSNKSTTAQADAAIVLGAAVWGNQPSPVFRERINHGIHLYQSDRVDKIIFTGGKGSPNAIAESVVARDYAIQHGVPATDILTETQSRTTYQNLYYAKQVANPHNLREFIIVSDPLHMKRSVLMAKHLGLDAYPSPTPTTRYRSLKSKLQFLGRESYFYIHYIVSRLLPSIYK